ncbi:MAG: hypothetical protein HYX86_01360 [Chloroflexi bacterium]|nr:hypothetical protein [Chloroflexota bacterium]
MATEIRLVRTDKGEKGWTFEVQLAEGESKTSHTVTLSHDDYQRLSGGDVPPERLVEESFRFLLERESKESILRRFDLPRIGYYFPEYETEMRRRLK